MINCHDNVNHWIKSHWKLFLHEMNIRIGGKRYIIAVSCQCFQLYIAVKMHNNKFSFNNCKKQSTTMKAYVWLLMSINRFGYKFSTWRCKYWPRKWWFWYTIVIIDPRNIIADENVWINWNNFQRESLNQGGIA